MLENIDWTDMSYQKEAVCQHDRYKRTTRYSDMVENVNFP